MCPSPKLIKAQKNGFTLTICEEMFRQEGGGGKHMKMDRETTDFEY